MHCLYCGKPLGFLKELTDGEFCSGQHRQRYKKLTKMALARLLDTKAEICRDVGPIEPDLNAVQSARSAVSSILFSARDARKPRDYSNVLRHFPRPQQIPVRLRAAEETMGVPGPSLPGFSHAPVLPLLGNAAPIWGRLDPVPPTAAALAVGAILNPTELAFPSPRFEFLSGMLRQGSVPTMREASFSLPRPAPSQPSPSSATPDVASVKPVFELPFAVAMPPAPGPAVRPSLTLAQRIPQTLAVAAAVPVPVFCQPEPAPLLFSFAAIWKHSDAFRLATLELPPTVELTSHSICERLFAIPPAARSALASFRPEVSTEWRTWAIVPTLASASVRVELAFSAAKAGFQPAQVPACQAAHSLVGEARPVQFTPAPALPRLAISPVTMPAEPPALAAAAAASTSAANAEAGLAGFPLARQVPLAVRAVVPESVAASAGVGPAPFRPLMARMPVVDPIPVRQALGTVGSRTEEVRALDAAAAPIVAASHGAVAATALSRLPALASLFRYSRPGKVQRGAAVTFEAVQPKNQPRVPLAYMEMPMPLRAPAIPRTSSLRIVETFQYLRPLDEPAIDPFQALLLLWRNTPAYLRFATVSFCVLMMLWAVSPGRVGTLAERRWADVRKSIQDRATIELVDNFEGGRLGGWEGPGDWSKSWTFDETGFIRPGKLAIYTPSADMQDYRFEFLAQIDRKAVSWVYRAADEMNYYAAKLTVVKSGPVPEMALVRYSVVNGIAGERTEIPIRMLMHNNTPYRVEVAVRGRDFSTSIEGQLVDHWRDARLDKGGVGFFSEAGERARLYWVKLSHQDDFVGRLCSYMYPNPIMLRSGSLP
jgi:hypothetical protein